MTRLESLSPSTALKLKRATESQLHTILIAVCELALRETELVDETVNRAIAILKDGSEYGTVLCADLEALVSQLDDAYFDSQEDPDQQVVSLRYFSQARAASAVLTAIDADTVDSVAEVVYEAAMAADDKTLVLRAVEESLLDVN